LTRQALREANRVRLSVDGGKVTLEGPVHSWAERSAIEGAVWSAPGVVSVLNRISVEP
jgi:osmotically-inducible protein OsmY